MNKPVAAPKKILDGKISPMRKGIQLKKTFAKKEDKTEDLSYGRRTKNIYKARLPRVSPKDFVLGFTSGIERAADMAAEYANMMKKELDDKDLNDPKKFKKLNSELGFWRAAAAYANRLMEERANR